MADDDEVTVNTQQPIAGRPYRGLSPLQAGLMYGGAASTVMGPLGILMGLGAGIVAKRVKDNYLDQESKRVQALRSEYAGLNNEIDSELQIADPDERRALEHSKRIAAAGWDRLAAGDQTGREMIEQANEVMRGIMQGDIQARKQQEAEVRSFQHGLISSAANDYRTQYQENLKQYTNIDKQISQVLNLVAQPDFDPNKPFNKAVLADLISVGVNGLSKNDPDGFLESLPVAGPIIRGMYNDDKYNLTGEDFNRIAIEMKSANEKYSEDTMLQLGQQARSLDEFARKTGAIEKDYSLAQYVTGDIGELRFTPIPKYTAPKQATAAEKYEGFKSKVSKWVDKQVGTQNRRRPTN